MGTIKSLLGCVCKEIFIRDAAVLPYYPARTCTKRGLSNCFCLSVSQSSKVWADHDNEGSKHFYYYVTQTMKILKT